MMTNGSRPEDIAEAAAELARANARFALLESGTRPEDIALADELRSDPKERAEHIMLVDLGRNDVGRVARYGSVELSDVLTVERYGHVLQARRLVGVRGAGTAYDGLYFVKSVTTSIGRGSFKQSFSLARNGLISITPVVPV